MSKSLNELRDDALANAVEKGFTDASVLEDAALLHSEISELVEDYRAGHAMTKKWVEISGKPCGPSIELADLVIRALHFAGKHGIDLEAAVTEKMAYNRSRPHKHGKVI